MPDIDPSISTGTVTGTFTRIVPNAGGGPEPDTVPHSGTVIIASLEKTIQWPALSLVFDYQAVRCVLDANGQIIDPDSGLPGLEVVASSQPTAIPALIRYRVIFLLDNVNIQPKPFIIEVGDGETVDISGMIAPTGSPTGPPRLAISEDAMDAKFAQLLEDQSSLTRGAMTSEGYRPVLKLNLGDPIPAGTPGGVLIARI